MCVYVIATKYSFIFKTFASKTYVNILLLKNSVYIYTEYFYNYFKYCLTDFDTHQHL